MFLILSIRLFADDTVLTMSGYSLKTLHDKVNQELQKIDHWMKFNKLTINYYKTKYMFVSNKRNQSKDSYKICHV